MERQPLHYLPTPPQFLPQLLTEVRNRALAAYLRSNPKSPDLDAVALETLDGLFAAVFSPSDHKILKVYQWRQDTGKLRAITWTPVILAARVGGKFAVYIPAGEIDALPKPTEDLLTYYQNLTAKATAAAYAWLKGRVSVLPRGIRMEDEAHWSPRRKQEYVEFMLHYDDGDMAEAAARALAHHLSP